MISSKSYSNNLADPRALTMANRSVTNQPMSRFNSIRRSSTMCYNLSKSAHGGTVSVEQRPFLRRAPPSAQFEIVTPPCSPKEASYPKGSRLPLRTRPTNPPSGSKDVAPPNRSFHQGHRHVGSAYGPSVSSNPRASYSPRDTSSMIPIRSRPFVQGWVEPQVPFAALRETDTSHARCLPQKRFSVRGALPGVWIPGTSSRNHGILKRQSTMRARSPLLMAEVGRRHAKSDPEVKFEHTQYPRLSTKERDNLVEKLRVLLGRMGIGNQMFGGWEKLPSQHARVGGSRTVFGTSVKDSSPYASCQVVLGDHSHHLPICVFASVEEICRRGIATPGLFHSIPPSNRRTLQKLITAYDQGPSYGAGKVLSKENSSNLCALLKLYLRGLPEAPLSHTFWPILQQSIRSSDNNTTRIAATQAILHLQHPTSFSLLIYVLAFLHQLALHGDHNGLDVPTLAEMFGPALLVPRKHNSPRAGCVMSPKPDEGQILVKTFQSAGDVAEGTRVMGWVLEHWDAIATGLLSLDIMHGTGNDHNIHTREASIARVTNSVRDSSASGERGDVIHRVGVGASTGESPMTGDHADSNIGRSVTFPFPDTIKLEQVPVHEVRNSIVGVEIRDYPHSTRASSPATFWSQDTAPHQAAASRSASLDPGLTNPEPAYVRELRCRVDAQEAELASLRRELASIKGQFMILSPTSNPTGNLDKTKVGEPDEELDEDMMPTPRPLSGPYCSEPLTMPELIDSLESVPVTPLFHQTIQENILLKDKNHESEDGYVEGSFDHWEGASHPSTSSDSEPSTPPNKEPRGSFYVVNPDSDSERESVGGREKDKLEELVTARDALRSALAAMDPVKAQLKAVEKELQLRGVETP